MVGQRVEAGAPVTALTIKQAVEKVLRTSAASGKCNDFAFIKILEQLKA